MAGAPLLTAILAELERADDSLKREVARQLRPLIGDDDPGQLLDAGEKAAQLGLHPDTLARMARAGRVPGAKKVGREWRFPPGRYDILPVRPKASPSVIEPRRRRRSAVSRHASVALLRSAGGYG
jgi:hypothetical protein